MYKKLYKEIIDAALQANRVRHQGEYFETHHIVPDFMFKNRMRTGPAGHLDGNPNAASNKVLLTFREHLMCHYYLYEIAKGTHYQCSAGSALQFFFVKATGLHSRQVTLSSLDEELLIEMSALRQIGIESISAARKGKMPAVDVLTRESIGSVSVLHPNVLSGQWVHHCTGTKSPKSGRNQKGSSNANYRAMSVDTLDRIYKCVPLALVDTHWLSKKLLVTAMKTQFTEYKKLSAVWITNHFGSIANLVSQYNIANNSNIKYNQYYRSEAVRALLSAHAKTQGKNK